MMAKQWPNMSQMTKLSGAVLCCAVLARERQPCSFGLPHTMAVDKYLL